MDPGLYYQGPLPFPPFRAGWLSALDFIIRTGIMTSFGVHSQWGSDISLRSSITRHSGVRRGMKIEVTCPRGPAVSDSPSEYTHSCVRMLLDRTIQWPSVQFLACSASFLEFPGFRVALGFTVCQTDTAEYMVVIECSSVGHEMHETNIFDISVYHNLAEGLDVLSSKGIVDDTLFDFTVQGLFLCLKFSDIMRELRAQVQQDHASRESSPEF